MGAWIETVIMLVLVELLASHPMWVRGLKHRAELEQDEITVVAPHVGAWIETFRYFTIGEYGSSHPMWVRGLKLIAINYMKRSKSRTPCGCVD